MKTTYFTIRHGGNSRDLRTNVWKFTCKCGHYFTPRTTMFNIQEVECPKCGVIETVNYRNYESRKQ